MDETAAALWAEWEALDREHRAAGAEGMRLLEAHMAAMRAAQEVSRRAALAWDAFQLHRHGGELPVGDVAAVLSAAGIADGDYLAEWGTGWPAEKNEPHTVYEVHVWVTAAEPSSVLRQSTDALTAAEYECRTGTQKRIRGRWHTGIAVTRPCPPMGEGENAA